LKRSRVSSSRARIKAIFFDVDGVLTDGRLYLDDRGRELKVFDTKDGHGVKMAIAAGLRVIWISGRESLATSRRARDLGVRFCYQRVADKGALFRRLCRRWALEPSETAAIGDDDPDVPLLEAAGFSACPSDAAPPARAAADVVLEHPGGRGAVREFVEVVLEKNGGVRPAHSAAGAGRSTRFRSR
jgi:3-deoxy-D-manno-octulosonate 8-phosphate phosphatase (KDO 8-P phosphatase)